MIENVYAPLVIQGIETFDQDFRKFLIQIRLKGTTLLLVDVEVGGHKKGLKWISDPYIFPEAIKDSVYQIRSATKDNEGNTSVFSAWVDETAGDATFGSGHSWTNSLSSKSTSIVVTVLLSDPPQDFERIEVYVRDASGTTGNANWVPDFVMTELSFDYPWVGTRGATKYFYAKAFDKSGNASAIDYIGSGAITVVLPGDMDPDPPTLSTVTASLDS